jgi:hypothetical protein
MLAPRPPSRVGAKGYSSQLVGLLGGQWPQAARRLARYWASVARVSTPGLPGGLGGAEMLGNGRSVQDRLLALAS